MLKNIICSFVIILLLVINVSANDCDKKMPYGGIGNSYKKDTAQFDDFVTFMRLAASGLGEFIDLIKFIRKNLPREQAVELIKLLVSILDDVSVKDKEICMPIDTLEKSFRELTNIIQEAIDTARAN